MIAPATAPALADSLLDALAASEALGVAVCDRDFRYVLWNRFMEDMTGLPAAAVLGRDALEIYPHLREEGLEAVLLRVLAGETVSLPDRRYTVPGVRSGWIWARYHPHRGPGGEVAGVIGLVHEVTERVRAEEESQRLAAFPRATPNPVLECDAAGRVVYANPAAGRTAAELGASGEAGLLPPGHADLVRAALAGGGAVHGVEVERAGRVLAWSYHPHPPLSLVHCFAEDVTARRRVEERLRHEALHDPLTGLPNRRFFADRLAAELDRARRRGGRGPALCFLDLDRFKVVNDSLGHTVGDRLLLAVAGRLAGAAPRGALVARLGGDEFAVLLDASAEGAAMRAAGALQEALAAPLRLEAYELRVTAAAGVVVGDARLRTPDVLVRAADIALHRAKAAGPGRAACFDAPMQAAALARLSVETGLRRALERGEVTAFYQPVVSLTTGRIVAAEALARWRHPERGWVQPAEFVGPAEETGLVTLLGRRILEEACRTASLWPDGVAVSVNLSVRELAQDDLVEQVRGSLDAAGLAPRRLRMEVTESVLAADPAAAAATLEGLRALGVRVWMDDFGTGYSSLSTLHRLPVDGVKVDRSFVREMGSDGRAGQVVTAILALAAALGLEAVAEGVEHGEQLAALRALGCGSAQGFLFAPALEAPRFAELLGGAPRW